MASTLGTTTVIGAGTHIKGEMVFDSDALIHGSFEGRIVTRGEIQIGQQATCKATIEGATVVIDGLVEGDVRGTGRVVLNGTARVIGNIVASAMLVAEGASLTGHCRVGTGAVEGETPIPDDLRSAVDRSRLNGTEMASL